MKPCALLVLLCCVVPNVLGRPQLDLNVVDDPKTAERTHPPSKEDLEERRQALVNALSPAAVLAGAANQVQSLQDLGLDLVGGITRNSADIFRPLTDATRQAKSSLPRLGDVINNVADSARSYRKQIGTGFRDTISTIVNNAIRIFTTASARGSAVIGGVVRLLRTLFDNFTFSIARLAEQIGGGIQRVTSTSTRLITNTVQRARKFIQSPRLIQPAREFTDIKVGLVKGLASDIQEAQPWKQEIVQSSLSLGGKLIPRVRLGNILSSRKGLDENSSGGPNPETLSLDSNDPLSPASSNIEESKPTSEPKEDVTSSEAPGSSSTTAETTTSTESPSTTTSSSTTAAPTTTTSASSSSTAAPTTAKATNEKSKKDDEKDALSNLFGLSS